MGHRGRCHCGTILTFKRGPDGFKMRCPRCHAVVRLREDDDATVQLRPHFTAKPGVLALSQPAPSPNEPPPFVPADQYNYEALDPGELPVVELVPLVDLPLTPSPWSLRRWVLLTMLLALVAGSVVLLVLFW